MGVYKDCNCSTKDRCSHRWQLRTRFKGKLHRISAEEFANRVVTSRTAAKELFPSFRSDVRQGKLREKKDPTTWQEFCDLYLDKHVKARGLNFSSDKFRFEILKERWKGKPLQELVKPKYLDDFLAEKKDQKASTRNRYRALFRSMLNFAVRRGLIEENPFARKKFTFEAEKNQRSNRVTREQERALWEAMDPWLKGLFIAAMDTGLRAGTLLKLRWQDVDREEKTLSVKASIQKDGEPVRIPISSRLDAVLDVRSSLGLGPEHYVFGTDQGLPRQGFRSAWKKALHKAGLDGQDIHWHDLRGEMASRLLEAGVSLRDIQLVLGHSSIVTTERYLRPRVSAFRDAFAKLEKGQPELRLLGNGSNQEEDGHDQAPTGDTTSESDSDEGSTRH